MGDLDGIAVTAGPGLIGGVLAGLAVSIGTMVLLLLPVIDALH